MKRFLSGLIWGLMGIGSIWTSYFYVNHENPEVMDNPLIKGISYVLVPIVFMGLPILAGLMTAMGVSWFQKDFSARIVTYVSFVGWIIFMGLIWFASPVMAGK